MDTGERESLVEHYCRYVTVQHGTLLTESFHRIYSLMKLHRNLGIVSLGILTT